MARKTILLITTVLCGATLVASSASAQTVPISQQDYDNLKARVQKLEQELANKAAADADAHTRLSTLEQQVAYAPITYDNGRLTVASGDGRFQIAFPIRFQVDFASYDPNHFGPATPAAQKDFASGAVVRRAYIGAEGRVYRDWWYEARFDFGGSSSEEDSGQIEHLRIAYMGIPNFRINVGVIEPVFVLDNSTSNADLTFIERSDISNIITGSYGGSDFRRGIELNYQKTDLFRPGDNFSLSGTFSGQTTQNNVSPPTDHGTDEGTQILGRGTYRLYSDSDTNIQIGVDGAEILSLTGAATPGGPRTIQFRDRPETREGLEGQRLVDTGAIPATGGWTYGFEGGANWKNFYMASEYYKFGADRDSNCTGCANVAGNPEFAGWYVQGSWVVTGEAKSYAPTSTSNGYAVWGQPQVVTPFSLAGGTWGAWEVAARYSDLDLNWNAGSAGASTPAGGIRGGDEKIWTLGLNWYPNRNVRMLLDYQSIDVSRLTSTGAQQGQRLSDVGLRLQLNI